MMSRKKSANKSPHRGRVQAQGGGVEKSESWAQDTPLSYEDGLDLIEKLKNQLSSNELKIREEAFAQLQKFLEQNNEVYAQVIRSFQVKDSPDERVDLEVRKGIAFQKNQDKS